MEMETELRLVCKSLLPEQGFRGFRPGWPGNVF